MQNQQTIGAIFAIAGIFAASAHAGPPVLTDDFNDNVIGDLWSVIEQDPAQINVVEQNMRLEFPAAANSGNPAGAAIFGEAWAIDATTDFRFRIDAHRGLPTIPDGDVALEILLVFAFDPDEGDPTDAFSVYIGSDETGPYLGYEVARGGVVTEDGFQSAPVTDLSIFVWYDASADTILMSPVAYFDDDSIAILDLRADSGSDLPRIAISAFTEGTAPAVPGGDLYFDEFVVDAGVIVPLCPEDVDGNGSVGFGDVLAILGAWGPCKGCPEDLDGDGVVGFAEVLRILGTWGECP